MESIVVLVHTAAFWAWLALIFGFIFASFGVFIPGVPGPLLAVLGALIHKWLLPDRLSWWGIGLLIALAVLAWLTDILASSLGAKWGGATRQGMLGALAGAVVGIFFGPLGLLAGPFIGAILGDLSAHRTEIQGLLKAGAGAAMGVLLALIIRMLLLGLMVVVVLVDLIF